MNKYKNTIITMSLLATAGLVGCSSSVIDIYNEFEASEVIGKLDEMVFSENPNRYDIFNYAKENVPKMPDIEMSSTMVNSLIYSIYQNADYYGNASVLLQDELKSLESKLDVDIIDSSIISKIPEEYKMVKAFLEEIDSNYLKLVKANSIYSVDVNLEKIAKDFDKYINNDTKGYLNFRIKESNLEIYNMNSDTYNIKNIMILINDIYNNIDKVEGVTQIENWVEHLKYYFDMIFSASQDKFVDENGILDSEILKEFKTEIKTYQDTEFGKIFEEYIKILEENKLNVDSEKVTKYLETVYENLNSFLVVEE